MAVWQAKRTDHKTECHHKYTLHIFHGWAVCHVSICMLQNCSECTHIIISVQFAKTVVLPRCRLCRFVSFFCCCFLGHGNVRNETNNQQNWQNYTAPIHAQHTQLYKSVQLSREIQYLLVRKNMWEICIGWEWDDRWKSYTNHTLDLFIRMKWGKKRRRRDVSLVSNQMIMSLRIWIGEKTSSNTDI